VLALRRLILSHRPLVAMLIVAAFAARMIVPTGYMITPDHGRLTIAVCSGTGPTTMSIEIPGLRGGGMDYGDPKKHGKAEMPCAFAGLSFAALGAVDPALLVLALAFVAALALRPQVSREVRRRPHLRPPLRGPPAYL
jgi:hypothetical protein